LLSCRYNKLYSIIILDCGREYIINQVFIDNGKKTPVGTSPWNVGVYKLNKTNSNYDWMCGGSIISPNLVVSGKIFEKRNKERVKIK